MNDFTRSILDDLRAFCRDLLEAGLAPSAPKGGAAHGTGPATFSAILRQVDALATNIPELIASLDSDESQAHYEITAQHTPVRARMPRSPSAWERVSDRMLPRFWEQATPLLEPDPRPLGHVQFVLDHLSEEFGGVRNRLHRHLDEARTTRYGTSSFAQDELNELTALDAKLGHAVAQLARSYQSLHLATGGKVPTTDRLFHPFPRSQAWARFRRLANAILRPEQFLLPTINDLLDHDSPPLADLPFLYQRWVGTRIVRELVEAFGCQIVGDTVGPIFLGGKIQFRREQTQMELWCEPRLGKHDHPSGLSADGAEATPDFVLITPGQGGPDAFVLDATMTNDPTLLERKSRYRERMTFRQFRSHAGVPGRHKPLRAWAAAPMLGATYNQLMRPDGSAGVVPMVPQGFQSSPLHAWLAEIIDHADAWQLLKDDRQAPPAAQNSGNRIGATAPIA